VANSSWRSPPRARAGFRLSSSPRCCEKNGVDHGEGMDIDIRQAFSSQRPACAVRGEVNAIACPRKKNRIASPVGAAGKRLDVSICHAGISGRPVFTVVRGKENAAAHCPGKKIPAPSRVRADGQGTDGSVGKANVCGNPVRTVVCGSENTPA